MLDLRELTRHFAHDGRLDAIYLRPQRGVPAIGVEAAEAVEGRGLVGDRIAERAAVTGAGRRQVTLLQAEHVPLIASWSENAALDPAVLRRNLVVSGLNLVAARSPFADRSLLVLIGSTAAFEITGDCTPCSKMETALGHGGYNALRGHGGVTARVVRGGVVRIGDAVRAGSVDGADDRTVVER